MNKEQFKAYYKALADAGEEFKACHTDLQYSIDEYKLDYRKVVKWQEEDEALKGYLDRAAKISDWLEKLIK